MTTESLPLERATLGAPARISPWLRLFGAFLGSVVVGGLLLLALLVGIQLAYAGRALPGVRVGGVDISGLTRTAAQQRLESALPSLGQGTLTLGIGAETLTLSYADLGRRYDTDGILDRAFAVGRDGDPVVRGLGELRTLLMGTTVDPTISWDDAALSAAIRTAASGFDKEPVDGSVTQDKAGHFIANPASYGRRLDQAAAVEETRAILAAPDAPAQATVQIDVQALLPHVLTVQAEYARARAELVGSLDVKVHDGKDSWVIPSEQVRTWIRFEPGTYGGLRVAVVGPEMAASVTALAKKVAKNPKDAAFLSGKGGAVVGVVAGINGRKLNVGASIETIAATLEGLEPGSPPPDIQLSVSVVQPKLSTEEANKIAPLMTRIGTWTTYYPPGEGNFFGANIQVPARIISGTVVPAGAWFSFWGTVGVPTEAQGYGPGGFIKNGKSTIGALAGGICSCSTTLFNAAVRAGLQIGQRYNHYYYIPRYPLGLDATVSMFNNTPSQDVTFRNDTAHPILIRSFNSYGVVRFDIYGVPDGRRVSFSKPIVKNVVKATDSTVYTTAIPAGTHKRVEFPHNGMDVWVTRTVTRNGVVIHQETFFSDYKRVDGELWIGVASSPSPTPTPTPSANQPFAFV
jgi:vancomycin resistance protein YoaR